ncbi:MAG: glycosyltransferase [Betaproteobacteria bacterium HGW-Betaproteobacteria-22]|nr:MAG: glycosyltransferase [Betaproteobacteria bacterium HGW-Betaproteobacteria-22]
MQHSQTIALKLNEAKALHDSGSLSATEQKLREVLEIESHHPQANHYLGELMLETNRASESLHYFNAALEANPQEAQYWLSYIEALIKAGQLEDAQLVLSYGRDAGLNAEAVNQLSGLIIMQEASSPDASAKANDFASIPAEGVVDALIGLFAEQRYQALEDRLSLLLTDYPNWLLGWKILSDTLLVQKKDARLAARNALKLNDQDAEAYCYYGLVLKDQGDLAAAAEVFKKAVKLRPDYAAAYNNLGIVSKDMGDIQAAVNYYRQALEIIPDYAACYSNLLFCLSHSDLLSPQALFQAHLEFGRHYEPKLKHLRLQHTNSKRVDRCLNVGFVSADFREHSLANFFEPVLNCLSEFAQIRLYAYFNHAIADKVTQRLRTKFDGFTHVDTLNDIDLAHKIREDHIDILIDLDGHTSGNRLLTFAMKPAPVQISWLGYLATTGLKSMDYYLTDQYMAPAGMLDDQFTETLIRLPANAPFVPYAFAPEVSTLPALHNGYITFGCFNRIEKITAEVVDLWSRVLLAIPTAKILLGAMPQQGSYEHLIQWFSDHAVSSNRLIFRQRSDMQTYLELHREVDICLDTFPSNGVTTTCHAAWMGVPTLCMTGDRLSARGAMAIMCHLGLADFVAETQSDFIGKALNLTDYLGPLAKIRTSLRERFSQSALTQPQKIADSLEANFNAIWQRWCQK